MCDRDVFNFFRVQGGQRALSHIELCSPFDLRSSVYLGGTWCVVVGCEIVGVVRQTSDVRRGKGVEAAACWILCSDTHERLVRTRREKDDHHRSVGLSVSGRRVVVRGRHAFEFEQQVSGVVEGVAAGGRVGGSA